MNTAPQLLLSLPDVATLAKVKRPAVSMWRSRLRGSATSFPSPVKAEGGQEFFDAHEVADWLVSTGHGNNPDAAADLGAFALMSGVQVIQDEVFAALTALLTLQMLTGQSSSGCDAAELLDLADDEDPDDELLYSELESVKPDLENLARYAELLADGAFNPAAAFENLMADRFRNNLRKHSDTALTETATNLVAAVAVELAANLPEPPVFADPSSGSSDLLLALAHALGDGADATLMTSSGNDDTARLARRRLRIHGISQGQLDVEDSGEFVIHGPAVHLAHYPSPGAPSMGTLDILTAIDHSVLQMDDQQRGVILAPDAALSGVLPQGEARSIRSGLIRDGRVRAIVRLPKGLLRSKPRQILALWVLGPAHPDVPIPERWVMLADLTGERMDSGVIQDLVSDLSASMGSLEDIRAHSFRFATRVPARVVLPGDLPLTAAAHAPGLQSVPDGAQAALRADALLRALGRDAPLDNLLPYSVEPTGDPPQRRRPRALADLLAEQRIKYLQGMRIDDVDIDPAHNAIVVGVPELLGQIIWGSRRIDRMPFLIAPLDRRTEKGDVIFCTGPNVAAVVDTEGGTVVAYPARILRIDKTRSGGLLPEMVAADINAQAGNSGPWKRWPVRFVRQDPDTEAVQFLAEIEAQRTHAHTRLKQLEELTTLVLDGVAGGTLTVTDTYAVMEGNS